MEEARFAEAEPWRRWVVGVLCGFFSLPWHYIFWYSMYKIVWFRDPPTTEVVYVLAGVGLAAYLLSRWAYLLFRGPREGARFLSNGVLWISALLFAAISVVCAAVAPPNLHAALHFAILAVGAALLALARPGKRKSCRSSR
jgi:hypothetical protein